MALEDAHGNAVATASHAALAASERALWRMMSFYGNPLDDLDAALAADPGWPLPRLMKAGFLLSLTEPSVHAEAAVLLDEVATLHGNAGDERERHHHAALRQLVAGDRAGAGAVWEQLLGSHPRDALALQWAHLLDFYRGDSARLHDRIARVLPAWSAADPLQPYVLGLHAFGLEETGLYAEAEAAGRQALAGPARVPWAIHAVAHVMEMEGRHAEGTRWLGDWRPHWGERSGDDANGFAGHLGWHEALFALETLDVAAALRIFDAYLGADSRVITLQRVDAASLLWRIALVGGDVGERWRDLLEGWPLDAGTAGHSLFNDAHAALALIGSGELGRARTWIGLSLAEATRRPSWNETITREIGKPLLHGLLAFGEGRHDDAIDALESLPGGYSRFGGSHAQRDVIVQTLLGASAAAGRRVFGYALLARRRRDQPATPLTRHWAARLGHATSHPERRSRP